MLLASCRGAVKVAHFVGACEYAEAGTDLVEKHLVVNQGHGLEGDRSGTEARFEIVEVRSGTVEDRSETEADHFGIEKDHPGRVEVHSETGEAHFGTEVGNFVLQVGLDIAGVVQMVGCACQVVRKQIVAEETAVVEGEQMEKAVAETKIPVDHKIEGMMSRLSYWGGPRTFAHENTLESQPISAVSNKHHYTRGKQAKKAMDDLHLDSGYHAHPSASHPHY